MLTINFSNLLSSYRSSVMEFEGESPGSHNATAVEYDDYRQQVTDKILEERRSQCHLLSDTFYINGQLINRPLLDGGVTFDFWCHQIQSKRIVRQCSTDGLAGMPHQLETWHLFRVLTSSRDSIRKVNI
jgi:hypothetical protein